MKTLLAVIMIVLSSSSDAADRFMTAPFVKVIDGDTIQTKFASLPYPLYGVKVRISGIDTAEKGSLAKCDKERVISAAATAKLTEIIGSAKEMTLKNFKWDKYGGRVDSEVIINGKNVGEQMIATGLAKPYDGGKKPNWCE